MLNSIVPDKINQVQNFVRICAVEEVKSAEKIRVTLSTEDRKVELWTCFAMGQLPLPKVGDNVLVAGEDLSSGYVIGVLPAKDAVHAARFTIEEDDDSGKVIVSVPLGDLDFRAEKGSINLEASQNINLNCHELDLDSAKGDIKITEATYQGRILGMTVERTKMLIGKVNSTVGRLVEKAKNVYRDVENLNQVKAGRMRTLVDGSYHVKGERIVEKARKEVRIDGEKINLG